jgi:hypothetical protein
VPRGSRSRPTTEPPPPHGDSKRRPPRPPSERRRRRRGLAGRLFDFDDARCAGREDRLDSPNLERSGGQRIEGHCDERGSVEYNLALGEKRARAAKEYLVSYGIPSNRMTTISYGKERPFDPGHDEEAWAKNRRAHFVLK